MQIEAHKNILTETFSELNDFQRLKIVVLENINFKVMIAFLHQDSKMKHQSRVIQLAPEGSKMKN